MTLSIVMATRNYGRYLNEAIASIYDQSLDDWKLYIADYGSTDGSISILQSWMTADPVRIKAYFPDKSRPAGSISHSLAALAADDSPEGKYPLRAINLLIEMLKGSPDTLYLMKFDPDDILLPDRLAEMVNGFKERTRVVFSTFQNANTKGIAVGKVADLTEWFEKAPEECLIPEPHIVRRDALDRLDIWTYDWDTYGPLAVWERALRILSEYGPDAFAYHTPGRPAFLYRQHPGQLSQTPMVQAWADQRKRVNDEYWARVEEKGGIVKE